MRDQRKLKGLKQWTVAHKLKVSLSYISKIEQGKVPIHAAFLFAYCQTINISLADFFKACMETVLYIGLLLFLDFQAKPWRRGVAKEFIYAEILV